MKFQIFKFKTHMCQQVNLTVVDSTKTITVPVVTNSIDCKKIIKTSLQLEIITAWYKKYGWIEDVLIW